MQLSQFWNSIIEWYSNIRNQSYIAFKCTTIHQTCWSKNIKPKECINVIAVLHLVEDMSEWDNGHGMKRKRDVYLIDDDGIAIRCTLWQSHVNIIL